MPRERPEEGWAALCIGAELGVPVDVHDDGSMPSMHDLDIRYADRAPGAVEVTAAGDPILIETWKHATGGGRWIVHGIAGGWAVVVAPGTIVKDLRARLPGLLRTFESEGFKQSMPEVWWEPGPYDEEARALGILHLFQRGTDFPGSVYVTVAPGLERSGGAVPTEGRPLLDWLAEWLEHPDQEHSLAKLTASGSDERHLFVILAGFAEAPFAVTDLLMRDGAPLPDEDPALPVEITHLWVASTWTGGTGMRWAPGTGWARFDKRLGGRA